MSLRQNAPAPLQAFRGFSYQSECHCAKTQRARLRAFCCLVTSQNVTAPKLLSVSCPKKKGLVTSQNVTAPKHCVGFMTHQHCLVTSQNVTAPKPLSQNLPCKETSIPTGSEITSEQSSRSIACLFSFILS